MIMEILKQYENYNGRKNPRLNYFVDNLDKYFKINKDLDSKKLPEFLKSTTSNRTLMNNISDANLFLEHIGIQKIDTKSIDKTKAITVDTSGILHVEQYKSLLKQLTVYDENGNRVNNRDRLLAQLAWWGFKTQEITEIKRKDIEFIRSNITKIKLSDGSVRSITSDTFREDIELYLQDRFIVQFHKNPPVKLYLSIGEELIARAVNTQNKGKSSVNTLTNIFKTALYNNYVEIDGIDITNLNNQSIIKSRIVYLLSLGYNSSDIQKILNIKSYGFIWLKRLVPIIYTNRQYKNEA